MGHFELIHSDQSSPDSKEHDVMISYVFYQSRNRTGVVRNASQTISLNRQLDQIPLSGYISDASSSVPRSSTISEPDRDDSDSISRNKSNPTQNLTSENMTSQGSQCSATRLSIAAALHRSMSDDPRAPVELLSDSRNNTQINRKQQESLLDTTEEESSPNSKSSVTPLSHLTPVLDTCPVQMVGQNTWLSSCHRWNPVLVVVNYSAARSHGYIRLPKSLLRAFYTRSARLSVASSFPHGAEASLLELGLTQTSYILLRDVFVSGVAYRRNLYDAMTRGIWFDLSAWAAHIFEVLLLDEL